MSDSSTELIRSIDSATEASLFPTPPPTAVVASGAAAVSTGTSTDAAPDSSVPCTSSSCTFSSATASGIASGIASDIASGIASDIATDIASDRPKTASLPSEDSQSPPSPGNFVTTSITNSPNFVSTTITNSSDYLASSNANPIANPINSIINSSTNSSYSFTNSLTNSANSITNPLANSPLILNRSFGSSLRQNVYASALTGGWSVPPHRPLGHASFAPTSTARPAALPSASSALPSHHLPSSLPGSNSSSAMVQLVQPGFQPFAAAVPGIQLSAYGSTQLPQLGATGLHLQFAPQHSTVPPQMSLQSLQAFAAAMAAVNPHGTLTPTSPLTPLSPLSLSQSLNLQTLNQGSPQALANLSPSSSTGSGLQSVAQNALQTQISSSAPSTCSDPESPNAVAASAIQVAPSTSMELVWHGEYERLFAQYYPHRWHLLPTLKAPENLSQWRTFKDSAKVRFQCSSCGHGWTSMKGRVTFWYCLDVASYEGCSQFKLYGQQCKRCANGTFEPAMWYPEEVVKVVGNVYNRIGQVYYGFWQPPMRIDRRQGKPGTQHNKDLCQACKDGECTEFQL